MNEMKEALESAGINQKPTGFKERSEFIEEKLANLYGEGYTRMTLDELSAVSAKFVGFVNTYLRPYKTANGYDKKYLIYKVDRKDNSTGYIFELCTSAYKYRFFIDPAKDYMSCFSKSRTIRVGDKYPRGTDLPDGTISKETFENILFAIVNYETLSIGSH